MKDRAVCLVALVMGATLFAGCLDPTQITLEIYTDVAPASGRTIHIGELNPDHAPLAVVDGEWSESGHVGSLVVVPKGSKSGSLSLSVIMGIERDPSGCREGNADQCIFSRRTLNFVKHSSLVLPVTLHANCESVYCDESSTCNALGECVSAAVNPSDCESSRGCLVERDELPQHGAYTQPGERFSTSSLNFVGGRLECTGVVDVNASTARSVSMWVKYRTCSASFMGLMGSEGSVPEYQGWAVEAWCDEQAFSFSLDEDIAVGNYYIVGTNPVVSEMWYHLVVTLDGSGDAGASYYVNGEWDVWKELDALDGEARSPLDVAYLGSVGSSNLDGWLDEVSVWDGVLTDDQVAELYNDGFPGDLQEHSRQSDLLHWFRLGEGSSPYSDEMGAATCTLDGSVEVSEQVP